MPYSMPTLLKRFVPALLSAAVAAAAVSCTDDDLFADGSRDTVREGVPVTVNLNFRTEDNRVETRARTECGRTRVACTTSMS